MQRPRAILIAAAALLFIGVWTGLHVPVEWVPTLELPAIIIGASWPGATPRAVERYVTAPIERVVEGIPGTLELSSVSRTGLAFVRLELSPHHDLAVSTAEVADRLALLRTVLPDGAVTHLSREIPEALRQQQGFMIVQLVGTLSPLRLRQLADEVVAPRLRSLAGVGSVEVEGGEEQEVRIRLRQSRLSAHGLTVETIEQRLREALTERAYGRLDRGASDRLLLVPALAGLDELRRVPLAQSGTLSVIRLADVATVELGSAPPRRLSRIDGKPVVTLRLGRSPASHLLEVAGEVRRTLDGLAPTLPWGVDVLVAEDRSEQVRDQLHDLAWRSAAGGVLVVLILGLILRSLRAVLFVLLNAAVALAVAVTLMRPLGLTINTLTLAGLALVVGLLVDNAVVVVERILAQRRQGETHDPTIRARGVGRALGEVWLPLLAGTLTTLAVMLPLVYASGELRALFSSLACLVALTLGVSLIGVALLLPITVGYLPAIYPARRGAGHSLSRLPQLACATAGRYPKTTLVLLALVMGLPTSVVPTHMEAPRSGWAREGDRQVAERYNATLGRDSVRHARYYLDPVLGGVLRPFLATVKLGQRWDFEPRPELIVQVELAAGSGVAHTDQMIRRFERLATVSPVVERTFALVDGDHAILRVRFSDGAMNGDEPYLLRQQMIAHASQYAGLNILIDGLVPFPFYNGLGSVAGFLVEARGPNYDKLEQVAARFAQQLLRDPRVAEVDLEASGFLKPLSGGRETLRFRWRGDLAVQGANLEALASSLRVRLRSELPWGHMSLGERRWPLRLYTEGAEALDLPGLQSTLLGEVNETPGRFGQWTTVAMERQPAAIERVDQEYKRTLRIFYRGSARLGLEALERELAASRLPMGYRLEHRHRLFLTSPVRNTLLVLLLAAAGIIYLILAVVFESWSLPWVVLSSVPIAFIGVALGFLVTQVEFGEGAFIGLLLLLGIAVNDSILLVGQYRRLRRRLPAVASGRLARLAVRHRLRPMWTTTLTTLAGMMPLLILPQPGHYWLGLAVTVVGGLLSSTLLAPLAIVAILASRIERRSVPDGNP